MPERRSSSRHFSTRLKAQRRLPEWRSFIPAEIAAPSLYLSHSPQDFSTLGNLRKGLADILHISGLGAEL